MVEDDMEAMASAKITRVGDEYFLPIDDALLDLILARASDEVEIVVSDTSLILRTRES
ncbi:MAG: hypothetical protein KDB82_04275 [Planctomycetes bacterium]|nr:hypothetical protein [Planctomycetota bacterium]